MLFILLGVCKDRYEGTKASAKIISFKPSISYLGKLRMHYGYVCTSIILLQPSVFIVTNL